MSTVTPLQGKALLGALGAEDARLDALFDYASSPCASADASDASESADCAYRREPLADEACVADWERYCQRAATEGVLNTLMDVLVQWHFPIRTRLSSEPQYLDVVRRFKPVSQCPLASSPPFIRPDDIELSLCDTDAGRLPVISFAIRSDFEFAWQSLIGRNEPVPVPADVGAALISGYANLERIDQRRQAVIARSGHAAWPQALTELMRQRESWQDRFVIVAPGGYSGINATSMGMDEPAWHELSRRIRIDHEAAHYGVLRRHGTLRTHLLDELLADCVAMVRSIGRYRHDWFLRFMGVSEPHQWRDSSRFATYVLPVAESIADRRVLVSLLVRASQQLDNALSQLKQPLTLRSDVLLDAIAHSNLLELAADDGADRLLQRYTLHYHGEPSHA